MFSQVEGGILACQKSFSKKCNLTVTAPKKVWRVKKKCSDCVIIPPEMIMACLGNLLPRQRVDSEKYGVNYMIDCVRSIYYIEKMLKNKIKNKNLTLEKFDVLLHSYVGDLVHLAYDFDVPPRSIMLAGTYDALQQHYEILDDVRFTRNTFFESNFVSYLDCVAAEDDSYLKANNPEVYYERGGVDIINIRAPLYDYRTAVRLRAALMVTLKCWFMINMLNGRVVLAAEIRPNQQEPEWYTVVIEQQLRVWFFFWAVLMKAFTAVVTWLKESFYYLCEDDALWITITHVLVISLQCLVVYEVCKKLYKCFKFISSVVSVVFEKIKIMCMFGNIPINTKTVEKGIVKIIAERKVDKNVYYDIMVGDDLYCVPGLGVKAMDTSVEEMSLPGSDFYPSIKRNVGAISVMTEGTELRIVGMFWRYGDYLITAKHLANAVSCGTADIYITNIEEGKRGVCRWGKSRTVDRRMFDLENNYFKPELDVFAAKIHPKEWSSLGIGQASIKKDSIYGQSVSTVGMINGTLMTSAGKTLPDSGIVELWHTASTLKGFSGSPIFCGNSVIGMHIRGDVKYNTAIRVEVIIHALGSVEESNVPDWVKQYDDWKYQGEAVDIEDFEGTYVVHNKKNGAVKYGFSRDDINTYFPTKNKARQSNKRRFNQRVTYEDESIECSNYVQLDSARPVHCNKTPPVVKEVSDYFASNADGLNKLGYEPDKYVWPNINPETEEKSVRKHLDLYGKRVKMITKPPTAKELSRCKRLLLAMLQNNRFEVDPNYKDLDSIIDIIDSSLVKDSKSPGHPYQAEGMPLNSSVIAKLTKQGLAQRVLDEWDSDYDLKNFIKAEPTKQAKVNDDMPRIVSGFPVHKMIKHQAIFRPMLDVEVNNWMNSPIKYAFNPLLPGHINHVDRFFKNSKNIYESDKPNWDYMFHDWIAEVTRDVTLELPVFPDDWTDSQIDEYLKDVRGSFDEAFQESRFRCTNGKVFKPKTDGIMKSGWLLTISCNSKGQLACDIMILMREGFTDEQILNQKIMAGGDDILQDLVDGVDLDSYIRTAAELGLQLEPFIKHSEFTGCEFFSTKFYKKDGVWTFQPQRFTKHVKHLETTKIDDLAMALSSHMQNYCWNKQRFDFFERMFKHFRKLYPEKFPLNLLKSKRYLQNKCLGMDIDC